MPAGKRANGAASSVAWGNAPGIRPSKNCALKARFHNGGQRSVVAGRIGGDNPIGAMTEHRPPAPTAGTLQCPPPQRKRALGAKEMPALPESAPKAPPHR